MKKTQFSLILVNKPGELANLAEVLSKAEVNIEALAISDGIHTGVAKVVVDNSERARAAFNEAGIQFSEQDVLAIPLSNTPGGLAELCSKLAKDRLSIDYVYGSTCMKTENTMNCKSWLMVSVTSLSDAEAVVNGALTGWPRP